MTENLGARRTHARYTYNLRLFFLSEKSHGFTHAILSLVPLEGMPYVCMHLAAVFLGMPHFWTHSIMFVGAHLVSLNLAPLVHLNTLNLSRMRFDNDDDHDDYDDDDDVDMREPAQIDVSALFLDGIVDY